MVLWGYHFREEWFLLAALIAVPVFLLARIRGGRLVFSSFELLPASVRSWRTALAWIPDVLVAAAAFALGVALAGPRTPDASRTVEREGIAIMMVLDTSTSMRALDLSVGDRERTRLEAVKEVFEDFVDEKGELPGRPDDAIGIVSFAGYADTRAPLTLDHDTLLAVADAIEIVTQRSEDGTALGDGLGLAIERLRESPAQSRVAILLTDGVNNAGELSPIAAADLAKSQGIKVYTVGAGTTGLARVRVQDPFGGGSVLRAMPVEIDEATLETIAERTGGEYFRATDAAELERIYAEIDELERTVITQEKQAEWNEYFAYCVGAGLALLALGLVLRETVFRRLP